MKAYYELVKPGIVRGNAITAVAGFLLASRGTFDAVLFMGMLTGLSLVIASACVFNNVLDRNIDLKMKRTEDRALVTRSISVKNALLYASILGIIGTMLLLFLTNILTTVIAATGFVAYVVWYGYEKRRSELSTAVGTISGATPPVIGYVAVTGQIDHIALLLFGILLYWQLAHFYAISLYRQKEYANAGIPLWPIKRGRASTYQQILMAAVFFVLILVALGYFGQLSYTYLVVMMLVSIWWLRTIITVNRENPTDTWARKVFRQSLIVILAWSLLLSVDHWLP